MSRAAATIAMENGRKARLFFSPRRKVTGGTGAARMGATAQFDLARACHLSAPGKFRVGSQFPHKCCCLKRLIRYLSPQNLVISLFIEDIAHLTPRPRSFGSIVPAKVGVGKA